METKMNGGVRVVLCLLERFPDVHKGEQCPYGKSEWHCPYPDHPCKFQDVWFL